MSRLNKVIFLVGSLEAGGLERFVMLVSMTALRQKLFVPVVLCLHRRKGIFVKELESSGVQIFEASAGWQRNPFAFYRLISMFGAINPDVVHSQVNFSLFQQYAAVRFGSGARFVVTERNTYPLRGAARVRRWLQFHFLRMMGVRYSANSRDVAVHLGTLVGFPSSSIPILPNGIDVRQPDLDLRKRVRERFGWQQDDFVVGYVARFALHKGHTYFLSTMAEVGSLTRRPLKVCFVGDGPTRRVIESEAEGLGLSDRVVFVGIIPNIEDLYHAFDCTALLSEYEGMPNVVIEAMAHGLPVVANAVGNVRELLAGEAGILNQSKDPRDTALLFARLANDASLVRSVGDRARERIEREFSLEKTLEILCRHYGFHARA
jgi:glycosyltransferase involved in cell wall biosynthesis